MCEFLLRDHTPLAVLFKLVCGAVSVELKGGIFRTLSVIASATQSSAVVHEELWHLIEMHRLLPAPAEGNIQSSGDTALLASASRMKGENGPSTSSSGGGGDSNKGPRSGRSGISVGQPGKSKGRGGYDDDGPHLSYLQGLRLELEDSESKLGNYAITDSFLSLLTRC